MIKVTLFFREPERVGKFFSQFTDSELGQTQHHEEPTTVVSKTIDTAVVISFADHAQFLVESSFRDGMLADFKKDAVFEYTSISCDPQPVC